MLPGEISKKVNLIKIKTRKLVNEIFAGEYIAVFKGRGMEFSEVREYNFGDDVRLIDWNVTARTGFPHVKKFVEERELQVLFLIDMSGSQDFGTVRSKKDVCAELASILAFSAIKNNDKVGMLIFTDTVEKFIPPRKGLRHSLRIIRDLLYYEPSGKKTDINGALSYLNKIARRKSVVFLISDFQGGDYDGALKVTSKKHDLIPVKINDAREYSMTDSGLVEVFDPETGESVLIDTSSEELRRRLFAEMELADRRLDGLFKSLNLEYITLRTGDDYAKLIMNFFRRREKRFR